MMANRYRKWRPLVGVLAVGMLAFGESLQSAPAGGDTVGSADRALRRVTGAAVPATAQRVAAPTERKPVLATKDEGLQSKFEPGAFTELKPPLPELSWRVTSMTGFSADATAASRGPTLSAGDPCSCDADCAGLTGNVCRENPGESGDPCEGDEECDAPDTCGSGTIDPHDGCVVFHCARAAETYGVDEDGRCVAVVQPTDTWCNYEAAPCTPGLCNGVGECTDGPISACAKECQGEAGYADVNQNCALPRNCVYGGACEQKPGVSCVVVDEVTGAADPSGTSYSCSLDDDTGRCCTSAPLPDADITLLACDPSGTGRTWLRYNDPDDKSHVNRCPAYSSGVVNGHLEYGPAVTEIVPPAMQCATKRPEDNFGAVCEVDADCAKRCEDDDQILCLSAADCATGGCRVDLCVSADGTGPGGSGRCPGPWAIGDDYILDIPEGSALAMKEFRFRGGVERAHEAGCFDFYDASVWRCQGGTNHGGLCTEFDGSSCLGGGKCLPVRTGTICGRHERAGLYTYTIERDCTTDCDSLQHCNLPTPQCECERRLDGCISDPPFVIAKRGFVVRRAHRLLSSDWGPLDFNGSWVPLVVPARAGLAMDVGMNDPDIMWLNDGPINGDDPLVEEPLAMGARVFAFEMTGKVIDDPKGACCDRDDAGNCENRNQWDCRRCTGVGTQGTEGRMCDRGGGNWAGIDRDCPSRRDECTTAEFKGPRTTGQYRDLRCHGGTYEQDGTRCANDAECGGVDTCYAGQRCDDGPCVLGACCQDDGTCTETATAAECSTSWGHCTRVPSLDCAIDDDCIDPGSGADNGPCVPRWLGLGSDCDVNCCPTGVDTGGLCCTDRYGCEDALPDHLDCDPLADPGTWPPGCGACIKVCDGPSVFQIAVPTAVSEFELVFDITGDTRSAEMNAADSCAQGTEFGWYERWHLDSCAIVTWNFCCTTPYILGNQTVLSDACPCSGPGSPHLPTPGKYGYGDACGNDHCCSDGNFSVEWTLRAGTYHIQPNTIKYCETVGNECDSALECKPGEMCLRKTQPYQAHLYVRGCPVAACCVTDPETGSAACLEMAETDCEDAGGVYLGNLGINKGCNFPEVCDTGACCLEGGGCDDNAGNHTTPQQCSIDGGDYHGGALCAHQPCAICEFENPGHCQLDTGLYIFPSDRRQGTRRADDFIPIPPVGDVSGDDLFIHRVCFEMGYIHVIEGQECYDNPPPELFHVHFYENGLDGLPGTELPESANVTPEEFFHVDKSAPKGPNIRTWRFSGPVGPPITGVRVEPNECYWIEITGLGTGECQIRWTHSRDGNNFGMRDDDGNWGQEDVRDSDVVFCIDTDMKQATIPAVDGGCGTIPVACCYRDFTCDDEHPAMHFSQCWTNGGFPIVGGSCETPCPIPGNDDCANAYAICEGDWNDPLGGWHEWSGDPGDRLGECMNYEPNPNVDFGQVCHPEPWEIRTCHGGVNDGEDCTDSDTDCGAPDICILDDVGGIGQDCTDPPNIGGNNLCQPYRFEGQGLNAFECYANTDNRLASTDGPLAGGDCFGSGEQSMKADVWYTVSAPCRGKAIIDMCGAPAEYDSMLAVFGDHSDDPRCPGTGGDNEHLIYCNDDYCTGSGTASGVSWQAAEDGVYLLRIAGWSDQGGDADAGQGLGRMHIGFYCEPTAPFETLTLPTIAQHRHRKHRYISINPTANPDVPTVIKVVIEPGPNGNPAMKRCRNDLRRSCNEDMDCRDVCEGDLNRVCTSDAVCGGARCIDSGPCVDATPNSPVAWLVQEPMQICDGCLAPGCVRQCNPDHPTLPYVSCCGDEDWIARLSDVAYADANNWQNYDLIHIGDCGISPGITYAVYACDPSDTDSCSDPLYVRTQPTPSGTPRHFGDIAGAPLLPGAPYEPPDGFVGVVDVSAWGLTKQNYGTVRTPQLHPTMADIHGPGYGIPANYILSLSDQQAGISHGLTWALPWDDPGALGGVDPSTCPDQLP